MTSFLLNLSTREVACAATVRRPATRRAVVGHATRVPVSEACILAAAVLLTVKEASDEECVVLSGEKMAQVAKVGMSCARFGSSRGINVHMKALSCTLYNLNSTRVLTCHQTTGLCGDPTAAARCERRFTQILQQLSPNALACCGHPDHTDQTDAGKLRLRLSALIVADS